MVEIVTIGSPPRSLWESIGWLILIAATVVALPITVNRAINSDSNQGGCDIRGFCDAGRYILDHGVRDPKSTFSRYWPSIDVPWIVFARIPIGLAAGLWYAIGCATWYALLRSIYCYLLTGDRPILRRHAILAAGLLATPLAIDGLCLGTFHLLMLWLMIIGLYHGLCGREIRGGLLLGVAAWLKLLPFLGVLLFLLRGKWKAASVTVVAALVIDIALSLAAFGPTGAYREHVAWWTTGATQTTMHQITAEVPQDEDRLSNQSVAVTMRRLLSSIGAEPGEARNRVRLAHLSGEQLKVAYSLVTIASLLALAVAIGWKPRMQTPAANARIIALLALSTLWFSPVAWSYHFTAALPALAIILYRGEYRSSRVVPLVVLWLAAIVLLSSPVVRAAGVLLWLSLFVAASLLWVQPRRSYFKAQV